MGNARWAGVGLARLLRGGGSAAGRRAGDLRRAGRGPAGLGPRFRQVARHRPRPPARSHGGVLDERRAAAGAQRLPGPAGRPRLVRHLLGQGPAPDHRPAPRLRRLLDGQGVPDPDDTQRRRGSASELDRPPDPDQPHERPLVRHDARAGRDAGGGPGRRGRRESPSTAAAASGGVEVSTDGGATWAEATLGDDLGRYSFRRWRYRWTPASPGEHRLRSRPRPATGRFSPTRQAGTGADTCGTSSRR